MREFLANNWLVILISFVGVGYIAYLVVNKKWTRLREDAYKFIRLAEKAITGTKKGQERFDLVLSQLYNLIPPWIGFFLPENLMKQILQKWFNTIKDSLDDGKINNSTASSDTSTTK